MSSSRPLGFAVAGLFAMAAAMGIGRFVYTPILPSMMAGLGLTATQAGLIASANYLGYLVGAFASAGPWGAGRERVVMLAALALSTVLLAAMGLATSLPAFMVIRFLAGLASAVVVIFLFSIVFARLAAAGRDDLQAVTFAGVGTGIALSSLLTASLHLAGEGWQAAWFAAAGVSVVAFIAVALLIDRAPPALAGTAGSREPRLPLGRALVAINIGYGLFGFGYIVTATFLVAIVRRNGAGPIFESAVWLVTGLVAMPSVWMWTKGARRIGVANAYAAACLVEAVGVAVSVALGGTVGPLLGGALLGGTFVAITALGLQYARAAAPASPRRAFALMTASFGVGQIIGPPVAGLAVEATGSYLMPSLAAALALVIAAVLVSRLR